MTDRHCQKDERDDVESNLAGRRRKLDAVDADRRNERPLSMDLSVGKI